MDLTQARRLFLLALIASVSVTALLAIGFLLFAELDETTERIILTTALISLFSLFCLPAGVLLDQGRYLGLAWTVVVLSGVAFVLAMALTWGSWEDEDDGLWKALAVVAAFAAASSQAAATTSRRRGDDTPVVRTLYVGSLILAVMVAGMVALAAWQEIDDEGFYRALGAIVVADVGLVIVQSVARRLSSGGPSRTGHRITFVLDRAPSDEEVAAAQRALAAAGARVERIKRTR
jgi:hypothetical protein